MSKSSSSVGSWPMAATAGSTGEAQAHQLAQGGGAHCRVARSSHASMAPLLSLSKRANASRHASISSLERDILTQKPSRGSGRVGVQRRATRTAANFCTPPQRERWSFYTKISRSRVSARFVKTGSRFVKIRSLRSLVQPRRRRENFLPYVSRGLGFEPRWEIGRASCRERV